MDRQVSDYRTSSTAWLQDDVSLNSAILQSLERKMADVTNVGVLHQEHLQVLNYGQFCFLLARTRATFPCTHTRTRLAS